MSVTEKCIKNCKSLPHGIAITKLMRKIELTDDEICSYANYLCEFCGSSVDNKKRNGVISAAEAGRFATCKWFICQKQSKIDETDCNGNTALYNCLTYGQIQTALGLIKLGASLNFKNASDKSPLDLTIHDNIVPQKDTTNVESRSVNVYVWGKNANYTLGPDSKETPDYFDTFHKKYSGASVKQIALSKYHTFILTTNGIVYACGNGEGGRLGLKTDKIVVEPIEVKFPSLTYNISQISIARDHALFVDELHKELYVCGSNTHHVLGIECEEQHAPVKVYICKDGIIGACCARYHSFAWNSKSLYSWGLNGGQIGQDAKIGKYVRKPRQVTMFHLASDHHIITVASSDGATAILNNNGDIYLLQNFITRKIASKFSHLTELILFGGKLQNVEELSDPIKDENVKVAALSKDEELYLWSDSLGELCRCSFDIRRNLCIKKAALNKNGFILVTSNREVFYAKIDLQQKMIQQKSFDEFLDDSIDVVSLFMLHPKRVDKIYAAIDVACDLDGENFAAIQIDMTTCRTIYPAVSPSTLTEEMIEFLSCNDGDLTLQIGGRLFRAHKYLLVLHSKTLASLIKNDGGDILNIENIHPDIFDQILKYIYTNTCDYLTHGYVVPKLYNFTIDKKTNSKMDSIGLLSQNAKLFGINNLQQDLKKFYIDSTNIVKQKEKIVENKQQCEFKYDALADYFDAQIQSCDGKIVLAHKTVLEIRSEVFRSMFSARWNTSNKRVQINLDYPHSTLKILMEYLYRDKVDLSNEDIDGLCNILKLADQMLLFRLIEFVEIELSKRLNLRNVIKILIISCMYNANQMINSCFEYICLNLAYFLENGSLNELEDEILLHLTKFYQQWNKFVRSRLKSISSTPDVDVKKIQNIAKLHPVNMDFADVIVTPRKSSHSRGHRRSRKSSSIKPEDSVDENFNENNLDNQIESPVGEVLNTPLQVNSRIVSIIKNSNDKENYTDNFSVLSKNDFPDLGRNVGKVSHKIDMPKFTRISQSERKRLISEGSSPKSSSLPESPKNPWKIPEIPVQISFSPPTENISKIMLDEKKQKENFTKYISKPLINTQLEDKAVLDLKKFYNVDEISDEIITVDRVSIGAIAAPLWVKK